MKRVWAMPMIMTFNEQEALTTIGPSACSGHFING